MTVLKIILLACLSCSNSFAQKFETVKKRLEIKGENPIDICKKLKYKYRLDTVVITNTSYFNSVQDSLSYKGKVGNVYGPYDNGKYAVQLLLTAPNTFTRLKRINFDTSSMSKNLADTMSNKVLKKIEKKERTFEEMAKLYNKNEGFGTSGELGYCAKGTLQPSLEKLIAKTKQGSVFKYWGNQGVDLIKVIDKDKTDKGYGLLLVVTLNEKNIVAAR